jgi:uncharacterized protein (TIGR03083 family)
VTGDLLGTAYDDISRAVTDLDDDALRRPTRCRGWTVADVLYHLLLDAQRALVTLASPVDGPSDVDRASYWAPHKPQAPWAAEHEAFVRQSVAAHSSPAIVVRRWVETSAAAARAASDSPDDRHVTTQGHVLTVADFVSTLVVEAVVHHLDLTVELPDVAPPATAALTHVREVFDEILGVAAPTSWGDVDYVLAATGRVGLPDDIAAQLGAAAARLPLLG